MSDFYQAFEERHRGPRGVIKARLRAYLPFVQPLKALYPECLAVDPGCGRGKSLRLLRGSDPSGEQGTGVHIL